MNEQERDDFIKKIGISADDSNESDDEEEENDPEHHKYNCKKCQVSGVLTACTHQHTLLIKSSCVSAAVLSRMSSTDGSSTSVFSCHLQKAESTWSISWSSTRSEATAAWSVTDALHWRPLTMPTWSSIESSCLTLRCRSKRRRTHSPSQSLSLSVSSCPSKNKIMSWSKHRMSAGLCYILK